MLEIVADPEGIDDPFYLAHMANDCVRITDPSDPDKSKMYERLAKEGNNASMGRVPVEANFTQGGHSYGSSGGHGFVCQWLYQGRRRDLDDLWHSVLDGEGKEVEETQRNGLRIRA